MDRSNNRAGIAERRAGSLTNRALAFMADVAAGRIKVIDRVTKQARSTNANDLKHYDYNQLEREYSRPKSDFDKFDGSDAMLA